MLPLPTGSQAKPHVALSASQRAWLLGCGVTFTHSPSPTDFRGLAFLDQIDKYDAEDRIVCWVFAGEGESQPGFFSLGSTAVS
jgi:hypothetical protein